MEHIELRKTIINMNIFFFVFYLIVLPTLIIITEIIN